MFLPLLDEEVKSNYVPRITFTILLINMFVFGYELSLLSSLKLFQFYLTWGLIPASLVSAPSLEALLTLLTHQFIHNGFLHFLGNMLYLYVFGTNVEWNLGSLGYLLFYLVCGVVAAFAEIASDPSFPYPMIGASGAIAGILGAFIIKYPKSKIKMLLFVVPVKIPAFVMLGFWFLLQLCSGYGSLQPDGGKGGVAYFAHIGGFVMGALLMLVFKLLLGDEPT